MRPSIRRGSTTQRPSSSRVDRWTTSFRPVVGPRRHSRGDDSRGVDDDEVAGPEERGERAERACASTVRSQRSATNIRTASRVSASRLGWLGGLEMGGQVERQPIRSRRPGVMVAAFTTAPAAVRQRGTCRLAARREADVSLPARPSRAAVDRRCPRRETQPGASPCACRPGRTSTP